MGFDFNEIDSPEWAQAAGETGIVYEAGGSLQYRFDGLKGEFRLGSETVGKLLKIRPFDWRWDAGERWSRPSQSWFDIAFLDAQGIVSVLSLNNRSAINVYADLSRLVKAGKLPTAHAITLGVSEATVTKIDDGGDYEDSFQVVRVIGCEVVTQCEFEELREFAATDAFDWHITGEVDYAVTPSPLSPNGRGEQEGRPIGASMNDYAIRDLLFDKHQGKENAIKSAKIVELLTGQPSTESLRVGLRQSVVRLRKQGYPIASRITGYYWATSPEEMILFQKWLRRKALHSLSLNSKITKRTMPALVGQLGLPLREGDQLSTVQVVSALIDMPGSLYADVQNFLDKRPEWDLDRLTSAAIELFLINQGGVGNANL